MCVEQVGRVVQLSAPDDGVVIVEAGGRRRRISTALLVLEGVEVRPGDWLQTHTGLAIRVLPEDEAGELVRMYDEMQAASSRDS